MTANSGGIQTTNLSRLLAAAVLVVLALAIAFNAVICLLERRCATWQTGARGGQRAADDMASSSLQPAT